MRHIDPSMPRDIAARIPHWLPSALESAYWETIEKQWDEEFELAFEHAYWPDLDAEYLPALTLAEATA